MIYVGEMECYKCDNHVQGFYDVVNDWTVYECDGTLEKEFLDCIDGISYINKNKMKKMKIK